MLKKYLLSLLMVSGLVHAMGDDNLSNEPDNIERPEVTTLLKKGADLFGKFADKSTVLWNDGVNAAKDGFDAVKKMVQDEPSLPEGNAEALKSSSSNPIVVLNKNPDVNLPSNVNLETPKIEEPTVRFAAIRNVWDSCVNSKTATFACDMFNPCAHGRAWKAMWNAGFKQALPTLWERHRAVIAGTAVLTTAAATAAYYAYKKGLFVKAKAYVLDLQKQYFVFSA